MRRTLCLFRGGDRLIFEPLDLKLGRLKPPEDATQPTARHASGLHALIGQLQAKVSRILAPRQDAPANCPRAAELAACPRVPNAKCAEN